jgi:hypothetical protein
MPHIELPSELFQQIEISLPTGGAVDEFVEQAVREKLAGRLPRAQLAQAVDEFDALCDEAVISAPGTHLTRDQLHERH